MTYSLRDTGRSQMAARLNSIKSSESSDEGYPGNKSVGPAQFKRGGVVAKAAREMEAETAKKRLDRPGKKPKRAEGGVVDDPLIDERGRALADTSVKDNDWKHYVRASSPAAAQDAREAAAKRLKLPQRASGGAVKGKGTNVNIIIQPQGDKPTPVPMPMPGPMAGPPPAPMAPPPGPQIPPEALAALASQAGPGGPPPGMPMRKRGGSVKMDAGAGSGEGRLEKTEKAKRD